MDNDIEFEPKTKLFKTANNTFSVFGQYT